MRWREDSLTQAYSALSHKHSPSLSPSLSLSLPTSIRSMQAKGTRPRQERAGEHDQKASAGVHRCAAADAPRHLQGEQASIQRAAGHHRPAAGPGAGHGQQLLYERTPPEPR